MVVAPVVGFWGSSAGVVVSAGGAGVPPECLEGCLWPLACALGAAWA